MDQRVLRDSVNQQVIPVVGVSPNRQKYGWIVYNNLKQRGRTVYAVNPNYPEIDGDPAYATLADLPEAPGLVVTVVPPPVTLQVVRLGLQVGVRRFWMQPGSESHEAIAEAEAAGATIVCDCILQR